jgi:hypothetical protein
MKIEPQAGHFHKFLKGEIMEAIANNPVSPELVSNIRVLLSHVWEHEKYSYQECEEEGYSTKDHIFETMVEIRDACGLQDVFDAEFPVYDDNDDDED